MDATTLRDRLPAVATGADMGGAIRTEGRLRGGEAGRQLARWEEERDLSVSHRWTATEVVDMRRRQT